MYDTEEEKKLGSTLSERQQALQDTSKFKWSEDDRCYVSLSNPKVKFDEDGEQIVESEHSDDFDDVRLRVLTHRYGYYKAREILEEEKNKGGK